MCHPPAALSCQHTSSSLTSPTNQRQTSSTTSGPPSRTSLPIPALLKSTQPSLPSAKRKPATPPGMTSAYTRPSLQVVLDLQSLCCHPDLSRCCRHLLQLQHPPVVNTQRPPPTLHPQGVHPRWTIRPHPDYPLQDIPDCHCGPCPNLKNQNLAFILN